MKLALAQVNPVVGDLEGNRARILARYREAAEKGADLVVFPELAVTGYPPRDLLEHRNFLNQSERCLRLIAPEIRSAAAVVGFAEPNPDPAGRPCFNAAAFLADGKVKGVYRKRLLPVYDVFDEERYFEPGRAALPPIPWRGVRVALTICEDLWAEVPVGGRKIYAVDPAAEAAAGADLVVNLSASPFELGKIRHRLDLVRGHAVRRRVPFAIANQVGGNDELVFDGTSAAFGADGACLGRARSFAEDLVLCDLPARMSVSDAAEDDDVAHLEQALVLGLADYARKCGFSRACLGLSGGIDSAVVAALAVRALGKESVLGVLMPSRFTSDRSVKDALALAANLGIATRTVPIEPVFSAYLGAMRGAYGDRPFDTTEENLQARVRGGILMALSNKEGFLVLSTGNKSELSVGYCTLYGDLCGGLALISDVPKTDVYRLAARFNGEREVVPRSIVERPPTAELREDQLDADSLPPYDVLDPILRAYVEERRGAEEIAESLGQPLPLVARVVRMVQGAEYKRRQAPPGIRVTSKAFGAGRRMPIASRWTDPGAKPGA